MHNYILTFDYELFGSGKGHVLNHLVKPTNKILNILDKLNIKATFFVEQLEVEEIISLKNTYNKQSKEFKSAMLLERQLVDIALRGHDIQLHIHPQWYNAKYNNGHWDLNFDWWRFSALSYEVKDAVFPSQKDLIKNGKKWLEDFLYTVDPNYKCLAFRAGGYNIGVEQSSVAALSNNGILLDSSICPGYFSSSNLSQYDYTSLKNEKDYWHSKNSFLESIVKDSNTCIELPIISIKSTFFEKLSFARIYSTIKNRQYKKIIYKQEFLSKEIINLENLTDANFDVCLSSQAQIKKFKKLIGNKNNRTSYTTLIGHPKDFSFFSPMTKIIKSLSNTGEFITINDFIKSNPQ